MPVEIHPTAIVEPGAQLGEGVTVAAYAFIGPDVTLGDGCVIHHHATVENLTTLGARNVVFPYASVGGMTQDLKYKGGKPGLICGDENSFREYSSVHIATRDGDFTRIGNRNHLLGYAHIAHECVVGDDNIFSGQAALGGHVHVGNRAIISWAAGVHQFCRIGDFAMIGACAKVVQDVLPYMIADGNPAETKTVNKIGMQRGGFSTDEVAIARRIYKALFRQGLNRDDAIVAVKELAPDSRVVNTVLTFLETSERGLAV